jgi:hypothetical protein
MKNGQTGKNSANRCGCRRLFGGEIFSALASRGNQFFGESSCPLETLPYASCMASEIFKASRWTRGNHLFRTVIEVTDRAVIRHKRSWFSKDEISISITKIASVHIKTGMIWSDILIESSGGTDPLASHGHSKADAQRIRALVEAAQGILSGPEKLQQS